MKRFHLVSLIGLLISGPVAAQELPEAIAEKTKALVQLISETPPGATGTPFKPQQHLATGLNQALASGNSANLAEVLGNVLLQRANLGEPAVLLAVEINALILEESRRATANEIKRLEDFFELVGKTAKEAKQPADLDKAIYQAIDEGNAGQRSSRQENPRLNGLRQQVSATKSFLEAWQDSLAQSERENYQGAQSAMRNTLGYNQNFLPRSEILSRLAALEELHQKQSDQSSGKRTDQGDGKPETEEITFEEIEEGLTSLGKAIPLMDRWVKQNQQSNGRYDPVKQRIFHRLGNLVTAYERYRTGLPFDLSVAMLRSNSPEIPHEMVRLLNAVELSFAKQALPRYLGLGDAPSATDEESLDDYFQRLVSHYAGNGRPVEARRIGSAQEVLRISKGLSPDELMGLRHHAAAQLQLEAGQWRSAVQSLHAALRTGSQLLPAKEIGQLLSRLEKEHPEEYQLGTYQPLPAEVTISYVRSDQPPGPSRFSIETNLVMPIPGLSPASESTPGPATAGDRENSTAPRRP